MDWPTTSCVIPDDPRLGTHAFDYTGSLVGPAKDIDGDGFSDIILGAHEATQGGMNNFNVGE